ncbi:MAG: hypothetical protein JO368_04110, partial [Acidimicrobiales bacterium]|nr:hypothetical protein [Acidimicrobiales bacterium]
VLFWAAPYWWVPHGPAVSFAGRGWLVPVSDCFALLCVAVVAGAAVRVVRAPDARVVTIGRPAMASSGAGT